MTPDELLKLAGTDPQRFRELFEQREAARREKRRAAYAADPEKFLVQNRAWRARNVEYERARNRRNAAQQKTLRSLYQQMKGQATQ